MAHYIRETSGPNAGAIHTLATKQAAIELEQTLNALRPNSTDYGTDGDGFPELHLKNRETTMTTAIKLPSFELLAKQPKVPHVARTVAKNDVANEYDTPITFTVRQSRNGKAWWIYASRAGWRMSNTLHTTVAAKAEAWIAAVNAGTIGIAREVTLSCAMEHTCSAPVTHIDGKGFVYCTGHGERRKQHQPCRKLRPGEISKLTRGETIKY